MRPSGKRSFSTSEAQYTGCVCPCGSEMMENQGGTGSMANVSALLLCVCACARVYVCVNGRVGYQTPAVFCTELSIYAPIMLNLVAPQFVCTQLTLCSLALCGIHTHTGGWRAHALYAR